jgi:Ca2+-binding EF-hand superfamily protein
MSGLGLLAVAASGIGHMGNGRTHKSLAPEAPAVTFTHDVAPILYQNCTSCHHSGEVAPFPLVSYDDAARRAHLIASVSQSKYMPPWKAEPQACAFVDERRLTPKQLDTLQQWADNGAPEGKPTDLPKLPAYPVGWRLGTPDLVLQPVAPYNLAADGDDVYRCFVIPTHEGKDKYLSAIDIHPGNSRVVHHVIAYLDTTGRAEELAGNDPNHSYTSFGGPGFTPAGALGGWVPGYNSSKYTNGVGIFMPQDADIVLQVHYHKDGKPESDLTKIGLYYATTPIDKRERALALINPFIRIPAGAANHEESSTITVPENITAIGITPHMHLLGHDMTVTAKRPDGSTLQLIKVDDWDFNWQLRYQYQTPIALPKGTVLTLTSHYNNTADNPRNPNNPPKLVTWGEQTTDEMCIAFLTYTVDSEHITKGVTSGEASLEMKEMRQEIDVDLMKAYDANGDGELDKTELAAVIQSFLNKRGNSTPSDMDPVAIAGKVITFFDADGDGKLSQEELDNALQFMQNFKKGGVL